MIDRRKISILKSIHLYLESGFPIEKAVEKSDREIFENLKKGVELSEALSNVGFPEFITQNLKVGEESGKLKETLKNIIDVIESTTEIQRSIRNSLIMPFITFSIAIFIMFFTISFVIPQIYSTISAMDIEVSKITETVSQIGFFLQQNFLISSISLLLVLGVFGFSLFSYKIPLFREFEISMVLKAISLCLKNGIEMHRAISISSQTTSNEGIKNELMNEFIRLMKGKEPEFSLVPEFSDELKKANETGKIVSALERVSQILMERAKTKAEIIKKAIEPIFFVLISSIILFIVIFMYMPIIREMMKIM